jgi:uncharacterized membrane protein YcaP (DUF421 family)
MWSLSLPWWEFLLRSIIVYVFLIFILRVTGKRQEGPSEVIVHNGHVFREVMRREQSLPSDNQQDGK